VELKIGSSSLEAQRQCTCSLVPSESTETIRASKKSRLIRPFTLTSLLLMTIAFKTCVRLPLGWDYIPKSWKEKV